MESWCIINNSKKPVYRRLNSALSAALNDEFHTVELVPQKADVLYFCVTSPWNIFQMLMGKAKRQKIYLYYHEPCTLKEKLLKGDALIYSIAVKLVQAFEVSLSDKLFVSNSSLIEKVIHLHPLTNAFKKLKSRVITFPLVFEDEFLYLDLDKHKNLSPRPQVLFLGRAHPDQRMIGEFFKIAESLPEFDFNILTRSIVNAPKLRNVNVLHSGTFYSDEERQQALTSADVVWNSYSVPYNQSGITPEALCFGCALIVSKYETHPATDNERFILRYPVDEEQLKLWILMAAEHKNERLKNQRRVYEEYFSIKALREALKRL